MVVMRPFPISLARRRDVSRLELDSRPHCTLCLVVGALNGRRNREEQRMVQRVFEVITGVLASVVGLWILFSTASAFFPATPTQAYDFSQQPAAPFAWIPAFQVFTITLIGIGLGALLQGVSSVAHTGRGARRSLIWGGRLILWLSTVALIALSYLALASIGLLFIPSIALALIACALAVIPNPEPALHAARQTLSRG